MGTLGLSLLFVGIVLVINGVGRLSKFDAKSMAIMNIITGFIIVSLNFIMLNKASATGDYLNIASGFLFGFTYIFIATNYLFKPDLRPFGWFSFFVAVYATVMSCIAFAATNLLFGFLWAAWAVLWLEGFLELVVLAKVNAGKVLGKIFPYLSILEGIFAAFIPAILMLTEVIK